VESESYDTVRLKNTLRWCNYTILGVPSTPALDLGPVIASTYTFGPGTALLSATEEGSWTMNLARQTRMLGAAAVLAAGLVTTGAVPLSAQYYPSPAYNAPAQLDSLVSRIALYPDPLLAQVLAAASFPEQIPDAAQWADQYRNLQGEQLADAIAQANLPFDPAVQALLPFPSVLDMMASDMNWTSALGNAVLTNRAELMDTVQRLRQSAESYGYLRDSEQMRVINSPYGVEIEPVNPSIIYVPVYDPLVVYAPPPRGFYVTSAIGFRTYAPISAFTSWGWGGGFNWSNHVVVVNRSVWNRNWSNRNTYVHNYGNWDRGAWRNHDMNRGNVVVNTDRNRAYGENRGYQVYNREAYRPARPVDTPVTQPGSSPTYGNRGGYGYSYRGTTPSQPAAPVIQAPSNPAPAPMDRGGFYRRYENTNRPVMQQPNPVRMQPSAASPAPPPPQQQPRNNDNGFRRREGGGGNNPSQQPPAFHGREGFRDRR